MTHTLRPRQPCRGTDRHPAADRESRSPEDLTRSCLSELRAAAALAVSPARQHTVRSVAGGGMCSLTAPFHLDKDFQGHVRFPVGSSPAPVKSQARSPGPGCAFPPSTSPGHRHNLSHSSAAETPAFPLARSQLPGARDTSLPGQAGPAPRRPRAAQAQRRSRSCLASRAGSSCAAGSG